MARNAKKLMITPKNKLSFYYKKNKKRHANKYSRSHANK